MPFVFLYHFPSLTHYACVVRVTKHACFVSFHAFRMKMTDLGIGVFDTVSVAAFVELSRAIAAITDNQGADNSFCLC